MKKVLLNFFLTITNTGERPMLNKKIEEISSVLRFAYETAEAKVKKNDLILDYGCGGGYGVEYLARKTKGTVIGFDIDHETINVNKIFFQDKRNIFFTDQISQVKTRAPFNLIVSFQVIEHLKKPNVDSYLKNLKILLKPGGLLFISTVNKFLTSDGLKKPVMPFHEYEYYPDELENILKKYFKKIRLFGQIEEKEGERGKSSEKTRDDGNSFKNELIRKISQYEIVRFIARHLPLIVKETLLGYRHDNADEFNAKYQLSEDQGIINKAYILIYQCQI